MAAPRAIVMTSAVGGSFGWFLQLVVAYTVVDITGVLEDDSGQPWAGFLRQAMPDNHVIAILALTIVAGVRTLPCRLTYIANTRIAVLHGASLHDRRLARNLRLCP